MHANSLAAHAEEKESGRLSDRCTLILGALREIGPSTDRQIMNHLDFSDMNSVRPRVTEMVKAGILQESLITVCDSATGKMVREVRIRTYSDPRQLTLL